MVFSIYGMVKWKGQKLANGIDGRFETHSEKTINRLKALGFQEIKEETNEEHLEKEVIQEFLVENEQPETNQSVEIEESKQEEPKKYNPYRRKQK